MKQKNKKKVLNLPKTSIPYYLFIYIFLNSPLSLRSQLTPAHTCRLSSETSRCGFRSSSILRRSTVRGGLAEERRSYKLCRLTEGFGQAFVSARKKKGWWETGHRRKGSRSVTSAIGGGPCVTVIMASSRFLLQRSCCKGGTEEKIMGRLRENLGIATGIGLILEK